jgi:hypothetical protein
MGYRGGMQRTHWSDTGQTKPAAYKLSSGEIGPRKINFAFEDFRSTELKTFCFRKNRFGNFSFRRKVIAQRRSEKIATKNHFMARTTS